ncbi:MAG: error-prone DNA polymerase [Thermoleophilaceae bacterium]|nr:error-prone DNA polymerase [Thermoleophilaceae bacterium]
MRGWGRAASTCARPAWGRHWRRSGAGSQPQGGAGRPVQGRRQALRRQRVKPPPGRAPQLSRGRVHLRHGQIDGEWHDVSSSSFSSVRQPARSGVCRPDRRALDGAPSIHQTRLRTCVRVPYVELHCHSAYSFLDGASHPVELAGAAAERGHSALALTDHDGLHGAMEMAQALKPLGVRPITGAELTLDDGTHLTLLCETRQGYTNLCRLITAAHWHTRRWAREGWSEPVVQIKEGRRPGQDPLDRDPSITLGDLEHHAEGLVCLSGCARDGAVASRVEAGDHAGAATVARRLLRAFGPDHFRIELQRPYWRHDRRRNRLLCELADRLGVPCVATGNVHVHERDRIALQDAMVAVRLGATLDETEPRRRGNSSHVLAPPERMAERFREHPDAVEESGRLAERLRFDLTEDLGYRYPGSEAPDADRRLAEVCWERLRERYGERPEPASRLEEELRVIRHLGLSGFFLLHRDMLELARDVAAEVRGPDSARRLLPPGRGRGSSVSSIVCYLTGLSHIDPIENELLLGRFLNEELNALPDIDLDFPRDIRDVLIPRVHDRYGRERCALVAAFVTFQVRSAVRDFAKALGLPPGEIERLARAVDPWKERNDIEGDVPAANGRRPRSPRWDALVKLARDAWGLPRHQSQHPGGMVISTQPLIDLCPVQPASMEGRQMVQWDKDSCGDAGFLKIDLLGLGMLSAVERCVDEIARVRRERVDLSRIPYDDKEVYEHIQGAETMGVFQIESRAQMQMLKRTRPETLDDLTVQVALVRPGPIIGGAVHPYIERRTALREDPTFEVPYEHPSLEPVLRDTLGTIVFQDQVLEVAMAFAGFSAGEAEGLRRAMSRKRSEAAIRAYEQKFIAGAVERGAERATAERMWTQIVGFSGFGFPKAHSAAFGLLAYQSTWLRVHYSAEFLCSLLNEQPMGFYPPDTLVHEAQRRGVEVLPPCVVRSAAQCLTENGGVRLGLGYVNGVREAEVRALVAEREGGGPWRSLGDLAGRSGASAETLGRLAWAGACDGLVGGPEEARRRRALWLLGVAVPGTAVPEGTQLALPLEPHAGPELRALTAWERMLADYGSTGVTLREHPLELMRPTLPPDLRTSEDLERHPHGRRVRVAGLVVARQRPATANGVTFMLLEDEHGTVNLIVPPPIHERFRLAVRAEPLVLATGRLEHREGTINVVVDRIEPLERPDLPRAKVKHIEPRRTWSSQAGEGVPAGEQADLRAVAPAAHSFGRRGR